MRAKKTQLSYEQMREGARRIELYQRVANIQAKYRGYCIKNMYRNKKRKIIILQKYARRFINIIRFVNVKKQY